MATWTAAARRVNHLTWLSATKISGAPPLPQPPPASIIHRRGLASGGDHHGSPKVNFWQDPMHPSKWKEEQFVIVSLAGWGALIYGGYKYFTKDKEEKKDEKVSPQ